MPTVKNIWKISSPLKTPLVRWQANRESWPESKRCL